MGSTLKPLNITLKVMKMHKFKSSTYLPLALLVYLAYMSYLGLPYFYNGEYLYYFGIIGATIVVVILLHFSLKRKEKLRKKNEEEQYGTYEDNDKATD